MPKRRIAGTKHDVYEVPSVRFDPYGNCSLELLPGGHVLEALLPHYKSAAPILLIQLAGSNLLSPVCACYLSFLKYAECDETHKDR